MPDFTVMVMVGSAALASLEAVRRRQFATQSFDDLGAPLRVRIQEGTVVAVHDLDDLRLVGDLSQAVGSTGSVTLGRGHQDDFDVVCVRWSASLASDLADLHASLGGLAPTVLISMPRRGTPDLAEAVGVLAEWGYRVHRVERRAPFRRSDRAWLAACSDRRIGLERQRDVLAEPSTRGTVGSVAS